MRWTTSHFSRRNVVKFREKGTEPIVARPKLAGNNNTYALSAHRRVERRGVEVNFALLPWNLIEGRIIKSWRRNWSIVEEIDNAWKLCPFSIDIRLAYRSFKYKSSNVCCTNRENCFSFSFLREASKVKYR